MKFVIIGMGQFGRALAINLKKNGFQVTIVDEKESVVTEMKDYVDTPIIGDASDERLLDKLDLDKDTYVIIAVGEDFERNILITALLQEKGVKHLYARSVNDLQGKVLKRIGVKELFRVEDAAATQLAARFINERFIRQRKIDATHSLVDVNLPKAWLGKAVKNVGLREKYHLNMLTLRRGADFEGDIDDSDVLAQPEKPVLEEVPGPDTIFQKGDVLLLYGKNEHLQQFADEFAERSES